MDFLPATKTASSSRPTSSGTIAPTCGLIAALASATPASFLDRPGTALDTAHFLRFTAAEAAVNQWDMYGYTVFTRTTSASTTTPPRQVRVPALGHGHVAQGLPRLRRAHIGDLHPRPPVQQAARPRHRRADLPALPAQPRLQGRPTPTPSAGNRRHLRRRGLEAWRQAHVRSEISARRAGRPAQGIHRPPVRGQAISRSAARSAGTPPPQSGPT